MPRSAVNDPLQKFDFTISIPGLPSGIGFQKCSGLKKEIGVVEYSEGGYKATHKLPGREKTDVVTLERGMYASRELEELYQNVLRDPNFRTTVTITQNDRRGKPAREWKLAEAWFSTWEGSDFDATSDDVAIEKVTIVFEYYL